MGSPKSFLVAAFILLIGLPLVCRGQSPDAKSAPTLKTRAWVYRYSPEPTGTKVPVKDNREPRIDAIEFLKNEASIEAPRGSQAFWFPRTKVLVTTLTDEDFEGMEARLDQVDAFTIPDVKMTLSVYEFAVGSEYERGDVADLERLRKSADAIRLVHSQKLLTTSGTAVTGVRDGISPRQPKKENLKDKRLRNAPIRPVIPGRLGSAARYEPVVGPDSQSIDYHADWEVRVPGQEAKVITIAGKGTYTVFAGHTLLMEIARKGTKDGRVIGYAVYIKADLDDQRIKARERADDALKRRALEAVAESAVVGAVVD